MDFFSSNQKNIFLINNITHSFEGNIEILHMFLT